jgi:hypothetical protein
MLPLGTLLATLAIFASLVRAVCGLLQSEQHHSSDLGSARVCCSQENIAGNQSVFDLLCKT